MADLRHQPPIEKAELEAVTKPEKLSATSMGKFDTCPRSFFLYCKHRGGPQSHPMARGELWHEFRERFVRMLHEADETSAPPEVGKAMMNELIAERTDLVLPAHEQHALRGMAWNMAEATVHDPDAFLDTEKMIELDVDGQIIRGRLDYAARSPLGFMLIEDDKSGLAIAGQDDVENGAKGWQSWFYPLLAAFGIPEGEEHPWGAGINEFRFRYVYPRFTNSETGELIYREVTRTRDQLHDFLATLRSHIAKIERGWQTGEFPASPGSHCAECPARAECPIPDTFHDLEEIPDAEAAAVAAALHYVSDLRNRRLKASLREFADQHGEPIYIGDYAYDFRFQETRKVDWEAVAQGEPLERVVKLVPSTPFDRRKVTPDEREALSDAA